jgi:hypothetical protein
VRRVEPAEDLHRAADGGGDRPEIGDVRHQHLGTRPGLPRGGGGFG